MRNQSHTWLQCDEIAHIQGIGTFNDASVKVSRIVWLQKYIAATDLRTEWEKIDKVAVLKEARRLLRDEQRKASRAK